MFPRPLAHNLDVAGKVDWLGGDVRVLPQRLQQTQGVRLWNAQLVLQSLEFEQGRGEIGRASCRERVLRPV